MVTIEPVQVGGHTLVGVEVKLPKTTLLTVSTSRGYIMCGALDVGLLNETLSDRKIIAARAVGVLFFCSRVNIRGLGGPS